MPVFYSVVSRDETVLARFATCSGNFQEVTAQVLRQVPAQDSKLTYSHDAYLFHYIKEDGIIYMCITNDEFERSRAFLFLHEIKQKFRTMYGARGQTAVAFAMNGEFSSVLRGQMSAFSEGRDVDAIARVHGELDELKTIMVKNIDNVAVRGERLELLINKAENLSNSSVSFRQSSRVLQRTLFWKEVKYYVIVGVVIIIALYFLVSMFCGGLTWSSCVG